MAARVKRSRRSHRVQTREPASRLDFESRRRKISMSSSSGISVLIQSWPRIELNRIASKFQCFRFRFCQNERFQVEVASSGRRAEKKSRSNCVSSQFFDLYEKFLTSPNYVTRRQSLKLLSEFLLESPNSQIMKQFILEVRYLKVMMTLLRVFIANPNKPREVKIILSKNQEKPLELLHNLSPGKGYNTFSNCLI
ncbi:putative MO25-like protein isoform B [Glycine soja]|uniref:Putative MO25-like protein isoform B n=1 Tax=Glycine soja TaxID=3848 RepID=A0A445GRX4_GLYSO|nr:putative MO25-like protein isoform B [Glycine soja]